MSLRNSALRTLSVSALLLSVSFPAFAQDANAVAERLKALLAEQATDISWTNVSGDASKTVIEGVKIGGAGAKESAAIGNLTLEGITEDNGAYRIRTATTDAAHIVSKGLTVDVSPAIFSGIVLPAEGSTDPLASVLFYETAKMASVTVKKDDKEVFALTNASADITSPEDGKAMEFTAAAEKFTADLTSVKDPKAKDAIDALGYQTINGNMQMEGSWQPTDGRMTFSKYDVTVDNAGTLGLTFDLNGYTLDFLKSAQEMSKKMAEQPEGDKSAQGVAMLGLMQQLNFQGATIRFADDSLTGKVVDYVAKQQGVKPADIVNQAKAIVPFLTAQLQNPDLSSQITSAVNTFLDNPKNLEIAAVPPQPVPFAAIAATGMSQPLELPKQLGLKVTANK